MQQFNIDSRQSIYFDISYIMTFEWSSDVIKRLDFQRKLAVRQLDFPKTSVGPHDFTLVRIEPSPLQVRIAPSGPGVSSIQISSERPACGLDLFGKEADAVCEAYRETWLNEQTQILQVNARIRHLYSCQDHAFKYLWEDRLKQDVKDFQYLGSRPVLGGGLRLVMPPVKGDKEPVQIEVKVESFFQESKKMFVETFFVWPRPRLLSEGGFDTEKRLGSVEEYAASKVCDFIMRANA